MENNIYKFFITGSVWFLAGANSTGIEETTEKNDFDELISSKTVSVTSLPVPTTKKSLWERFVNFDLDDEEIE
ncbi:MAG: hypothetical protein ACRC2K_13400 [Clostridium sp.]